MVENLFGNTVEWQNWGWNATTASFIGTVALSVLCGWGVWRQNEAVWRSKSGESVSVPLFSYLCGNFFIFLCYGVLAKSVAMVVNGLQAVLYLSVVVGLWKYKGFTDREKALCILFASLIVTMVSIPPGWRDSFLALVFAGGLFVIADQPRQIWRNKNAGNVDIHFLVVFAVSAAFWTAYGITIKNWVLTTVNPITFVIMTTTAVLWFKYRKRPPAPCPREWALFD